MAENERGMDVEFIHPTAFCVLKSRNWPSLVPSGASRRPPAGRDAPELTEGQKVFINICTSDKLNKPEVKPSGDGRHGAHWSIPHSFSPPVEDMDKEKKICVVSQCLLLTLKCALSGVCLVENVYS